VVTGPLLWLLPSVYMHIYFIPSVTGKSCLLSHPHTDWLIHLTGSGSVPRHPDLSNYLGNTSMSKFEWKQLTSVFFFVNKRKNDKLPFARWVIGKVIKENRLGCRFPFEMTQIRVFIYSIIKDTYRYINIYIYIYLHGWASPFSQFANRQTTNFRAW
jgi:hypothetical protein